MANPQIAVVITGKTTSLDAAISHSEKQMAGVVSTSKKTQQQLQTMSRHNGVERLTKGFDKAAHSSFDLFKNVSRIVDPLGAITGGATIAGLAALSRSIAGIGQGQLNAARGINMGAQQLGAWQNAAHSAGATAGDATSSISGLEKAVTDMRFKNSPANGGANQILGAGWQQRYKSDSSILMAISRHLQGLHGQAKASAMEFAEQTFGLTPAFAQNFLARGPAYVQRELAKGMKSSMDTSQLGNLDQLATGFTHLENSITGASEAAVANIAPKLTPALNGLSKWIDAHQKAVGDFAMTISGLTVSLTGLAAIKVGKRLLTGPGTPAAAPGEGAPPAGKGGPSFLRNLPGPLALAYEVLTGGLPDGADTPDLHRQFPGLGPYQGPDHGPGFSRQDFSTNAGNAIRGAFGHLGNLYPDIEAEVRKDALAAGIDPDRAVAQFRVEGGGYNKVSPAGAFGPAQLMPGTAAQLGVATSVDDPTYDWRANVRAGIAYQAQMQRRYFGNQDMAEAAYNWGPGHVDRWNGDPSDLPIETRKYIAMIDGISTAEPNPSARSAAPLYVAPRDPDGGDGHGVHTINLQVHGLPAGAKVTARSSGAGATVLKTATSMPDAVSHAGMYQSGIDGDWHPS